MDAQPPQAPAESAGADRFELLRRWILLILVLGLLGTVTELVLLEHYEQPLQFVPLVLIAAAVGVLWWEFRRHDVASRRATQIVMALFVLAGFVGFVAHFQGSAEYQLELNPEMSNWGVWEKVLRAIGLPLLAQGVILHVGVLGLADGCPDSRDRRG